LNILSYCLSFCLLPTDHTNTNTTQHIIASRISHHIYLYNNNNPNTKTSHHPQLVPKTPSSGDDDTENPFINTGW
jgi:hypothetical protein